jgi:FkbM family methyltransferase
LIKKYYSCYRQWQKLRGRKKKTKIKLNKRIEFYSKFISVGDLCFDIGANIGNRTEAFLKLGAKVIAVEPQRDCADFLKETFGDNENFTLVKNAIADKKGSTEMLVSNASTLSSMSPKWIDYIKKNDLFEGCSWDQSVVVETISLDDLIATHGQPDFCKIDVEGYEYQVLKGLSLPIKMISTEYVAGFINPTIKGIQHLDSLGKVRFNYSQGESMSFMLSDWLPADEMIKLLNGINDDKDSGDVYALYTL